MKELLDYLDNMVAALTIAACGLVYVNSDDGGLSWLILFVLLLALISIGVVQWAIREREYYYLISYIYKGGMGRWTLVRGTPIKSSSDIHLIETDLRDNANLKNALVTSYQLISKK